MRNFTKALLIFSLLSLIVFVVVRLGSLEMEPILYTPLVLSGLFFLIAVFLDLKLFIEFFMLKTTRHGLGLGVSVLLFVVLIVAVNFIAFRNNKTVDFTEEKLYSLSQQTRDILGTLDEEIEFQGFFIKANPQHVELKARFVDQIKLLKAESELVKLDIVDPLMKPGLAKENEITEAGGILVKYKGRKANVDASVTEEDLINAIIKVSRDREKSLYFTTKHSEIDIDGLDENGGKLFQEDLAGSRYETKKLNLIDLAEVPDDAEAVFVLGPKSQFLETERSKLMSYLNRGGSLFLALDPGESHNFNSFLSEFGLEVTGDFILDDAGTGAGGLSFSAFGQNFARDHEVTGKLPEELAIFLLATEIKITDRKPGLNYNEIVKTGPMAMSTDRLDAEMKVTAKGPFTLAVSVAGKLNSESENPFNLIVFADSDFLKNTQYINFLNRDLAMNSAAYLAKDNDLVTLRPKRAESTMLAGVTSTEYKLFNVFPFTMLPLIMIVAGGVLYMRRKGA